ncbi:major facilitator superfamily domain-containing protein 4A isoform X2 [Electrophorus electricus]|uniref:major facilitator superfamily domain-containing protein 4A isoform X2 n=1 Tax=Electrophorus electricus TaxID=8005 RepID=UPI000F09AEF3|nr:major facilitator superfamily domain-containing protein 4A isoform X2 [Electrophorus electricus]
MAKVVDERTCALFRSNWQHTLTYWSVFFSFGLCIAFLGPTVLDLRCQTHSTLQGLTLVFFAQQFCLLMGSSVGGFFSKSLACSLWSLAGSTFIISAVFAFIPVCANLPMLAVAMAIAGLAMGVIDTISNLQLVKIYQKDSTVFLQALHFFVGLGALVSPLIADPFLSEMDCVLEVPVVTNVSYAFWIMALINLPVPIAVFVLIYRERLLSCWFERNPRLLDSDVHMYSMKGERSSWQQDVSSLEGPEPRGYLNLLNSCPLSKLKELPLSFFGLHLLGGLVLFFSDGIVGSYTGFVYTYAVAPPMSLTHKVAGYLNSVFWASITLGRLASIALSCHIKPVHLLTINQVGVIVMLFLLLMCYTSSVFLFVGTCFLGLFISSVYPCMLALTEDILDYKGCATAVLVTCAGMGEMLLQLIVGSVIHAYGSYSFLLSGLVFGCIGFLLFLMLLVVDHICKHDGAAAQRTHPEADVAAH